MYRSQSLEHAFDCLERKSSNKLKINLRDILKMYALCDLRLQESHNELRGLTNNCKNITRISSTQGMELLMRYQALANCKNRDSVRDGNIYRRR